MDPILSIVLNTRQDLKPMNGSNTDIYKFLFDSLETQRFKSFEAIVVDGHYEERKTYLEYLMSQYNFPIKHIPPAPSRIFKDGRYENNYQISRYRNSGFVFCRGPLVMFIDDCICPSTDRVLEQMVGAFHRYGAIVKPLINRYKLLRTGDSAVEYDPNIKHLDCRPGHQILMQGSGQQGGVYFFPSGLIEYLNGFDEVFDGGKGSEDCEFNNRVDLSGVHRFYITGGEYAPQTSFNLVEHSHKGIEGIDLCQCNEAYAHWIYQETKQKKLRANSSKLTENEVEEITKICKTTACPTFRNGACRRQSGVNRTLFTAHCPVFRLSEIRKEMVARSSDFSVSFDPWSSGNPFDIS